MIVTAGFFILTACATNPVTGRTQLMLVSEQQEIQMGQQAAPAANWEFGGEYNDRELESYLGSIVKRIWNISERPDMPVSFHIQNTSIPNAFALPGYVAMTRGLLVELENEAQFVSIMGHEAGHVMARHSASRMSLGIIQQVGLGLGGALLSNTTGADALMTLGAVGSSLLLLKYDRSQELQADRLGVKYASRLGYDPYEAITAHERLEIAADRYLKRAGKNTRSGGFFEEILSTHPRKEVRVEEIRDMIQGLPPYSLKGDGKFTAEFQGLTAGIREVQEAYIVYDDAERSFEKKSYDEAERLLQKALAMDPRQAPFYDLKGRISLARKDYNAATGHFNRALSVDSGYQPSLFGMGVTEYKKNNPGSALEYLKKSLDLYPGHIGSIYASGLCYHELNRPQEALSFFGTVAERVSKHPDIYGYMGVNYEKISKINFAIEAYTAQIRINPDNEMGRLARQRLSVLKSRGTP